MAPFLLATGSKPESARLALLTSLSSTSPLLGQKVRIAGRTLAVDRQKSHVLLEYNNAAVLVDLSLCLRSEHLPGLRSIVMVTGNLEQREADDRGLPVLTLNYPTPSLDPRVVVRAIILSPATDDQDLDLREWAEAIELAEEE